MGLKYDRFQIVPLSKQIEDCVHIFSLESGILVGDFFSYLQYINLETVHLLLPKPHQICFYLQLMPSFSKKHKEIILSSVNSSENPTNRLFTFESTVDTTATDWLSIHNVYIYPYTALPTVK